MKKTHDKISLDSQKQNNTALYLLTAGFFLGGLFGCIFASSVSGNGSLALSSYIQNFLSASRDGTLHMPGVLASAWSILRWPLITILLSFSALGVIGIPVLFFIRGFLFAFCISSFVQVLGKTGLLIVFVLLGPESLLSIPVLFIFGIQGLILAVKIKEKKSKPKPLRPYINNPSVALRNAICIFILICCIVWEILFAPMLLSWVTKLFPV
jgi:hypothetical protein